jgi:hypothetical protein
VTLPNPDRPDLLDRLKRRWKWDPKRNAYRLPNLPASASWHIAASDWTREALDTLYGPLEEAPPEYEEATELARDFINAARLHRGADVEAVLDQIAPRNLADQDAHIRVHLLAAAGAMVTGAAARVRMGEDPDTEPDGFHSFELEADDGGPVPASKYLAARLLTAGANIDTVIINALIMAACRAAEGPGCDLVTQAVLELLSMFNALEGDLT